MARINANIMTRNVILISDLHVGSVTGLLGVDFKLSEGNTVTLNDLQKELLEKWEQFKIDVGEYDTVFLLGDLICGLNKHELGKHVILPDLNEQKRAAVELLEPVCKNKFIFGLSGSRYHGSDDFEVEKEIVESLGGEFGGPIATITLKGTGKRFNVRHGRGAMPEHAGTKMDKEIQTALMQERLEKIPNIDCLILAHYHIFRQYYSNGKLFVLNGCWEAPRNTIYNSGSFLKYQPDIGSVKLTVSNSNIIVTPYLYQLRFPTENIIKI